MKNSPSPLESIVIYDTRSLGAALKACGDGLLCELAEIEASEKVGLTKREFWAYCQLLALIGLSLNDDELIHGALWAQALHSERGSRPSSVDPILEFTIGLALEVEGQSPEAAALVLREALQNKERSEPAFGLNCEAPELLLRFDYGLPRLSEAVIKELLRGLRDRFHDLVSNGCAEARVILFVLGRKGPLYEMYLRASDVRVPFEHPDHFVLALLKRWEGADFGQLLLHYPEGDRLLVAERWRNFDNLKYSSDEMPESDDSSVGEIKLAVDSRFGLISLPSPVGHQEQDEVFLDEIYAARRDLLHQSIICAREVGLLADYISANPHGRVFHKRSWLFDPHKKSGDSYCRSAVLECARLVEVFVKYCILDVTVCNKELEVVVRYYEEFIKAGGQSNVNLGALLAELKKNLGSEVQGKKSCIDAISKSRGWDTFNFSPGWLKFLVDRELRISGITQPIWQGLELIILLRWLCNKSLDGWVWEVGGSGVVSCMTACLDDRNRMDVAHWSAVPSSQNAVAHSERCELLLKKILRLCDREGILEVKAKKI